MQTPSSVYSRSWRTWGHIHEGIIHTYMRMYVDTPAMTSAKIEHDADARRDFALDRPRGKYTPCRPSLFKVQGTVARERVRKKGHWLHAIYEWMAVATNQEGSPTVRLLPILPSADYPTQDENGTIEPIAGVSARSGEKKMGKTYRAAIARSRWLILNSFAPDFESVVSQPWPRRLRRNDKGDSTRRSHWLRVTIGHHVRVCMYIRERHAWVHLRWGTLGSIREAVFVRISNWNKKLRERELHLWLIYGSLFQIAAFFSGARRPARKHLSRVALRASPGYEYESSCSDLQLKLAMNGIRRERPREKRAEDVSELTREITMFHAEHLPSRQEEEMKKKKEKAREPTGAFVIKDPGRCSRGLKGYAFPGRRIRYCLTARR